MNLSLPRSSPAILRAGLASLAFVFALPLHAAGISGTVRSATTNQPLQGMVVQAYGADGQPAATGTTDTNGIYGLSLSSAGQFRVLAYDNSGGYATAFANGADSYDSTPVLTLGATETARVDFQLQAGVTISGTVRVSGTPMAGIVVAAYNAGSGTRRGWTSTHSDPTTLGAYAMVLPAGSYKLVAYDDFGTLGPLFYGNKVAFDTAPVVTVVAGQPQPGVDFALQPSARVTGGVVDASSGNGVAGATLYAYTSDGYLVRSTTADATGQFRLIVAAGSYRFVAADLSGVHASAFPGAAETFAKSPTFTLAAGQAPSAMTFRLDRAGIVRGRTADKNGAAIPSMQITAYNDDGTPRMDAKTDATGTFSMSLPPGSFRIAAYDNTLAYATQFFSGAVNFASATPISTTSGQITPGVDFNLNRAGHFTGAVSEIVTTAPLPGLTVAAYDDSRVLVSSATTNASGQYTLAVPAGTYRLVAWDGGLVYANSFDGGAADFESTAPRTIAADSSQSANFTMRRGVTITGKVVTAAQAAVAGIEVDALDMEGHHVAGGISAADGSFAIPVVAASYKLFVHDPQRRFLPSFYGAATLSGATVISVPSSGAPAPVTIAVASATRRRSVAH